MKLSYIVGCLIYRVIGNHLPKSDARIKLGGKRVRVFAAKLMLTKVGKHVNVERGAHISHTTEIGDYSGIGEKADFTGGLLLVIM